MTQIENARIKDADVVIEDRGHTTLFVRFDYGGSSQGFPLFRFDKNSGLAYMSRRLMDVCGVHALAHCVGKPVRVKRDGHSIAAVGHFIDDNWLTVDEILKHCKGGDDA